MTRLIAFVAVVCSLARPASAQDKTGDRKPPSDSPKPTFEKLCAAHSTEPACTKISKLTDDDKWLVMRAACRDPKEVSKPCTEYRQTVGGVLIYHARTGTWESQWEQQAWPLKFDVAGTPTLRLKPRNAKDLKIVAEGVSPLVYSAKPGTPKEQDSDVVTNLKTFLGFAATGIQAVIQTAAFSPIALSQPTGSGTDAIVPFGEPVGGGRGGGAVHGRGVRPPPPPPPPAPEPPAVAPIARVIQDRNDLLLTLNQKITGLSTQLDAVEKARQAFVDQAQKAEDGEHIETSALKPADTAALNAAFTAFTSAVDALTKNTNAIASCQPLLSSYAMLLSSPKASAVFTAFESQLQAALRASSCGTPGIVDAMQTEQKSAATASTMGDAQIDEWLKLRVATMDPLVQRLTKVKSTESDVWDAADKVKSGWPAVLASVDTLARQVDLGLLHSWNGAVIDEIAVTRQNPELPWDKVQTHSIVVKAVSPYVKDLTLGLPDEGTHEYKLESATGEILGYDIGVVYTPLHDSTWTAVSSADGTKVIGETKRETRAGDLAAFLVYRFMEHRPAPKPRIFELTLNAGVALTTDHPAFFLGPGAQIWRAVRVSAGWAPERTTVLAPDQTPNVTKVSSNDDIRTVTRFQTKNWYVSIAVALDSLSLFNKS